MIFDEIKCNSQDLEKFFSLSLNIEIAQILKKAKIITNHNIDDIMIFIGCFKKIDTVITGYNLCLPEITNLTTLLINIHEISHAITVNLNIGKFDWDDPFEECIPIAMERIYIEKYQPKFLSAFNKYQLDILLKMKSDTNKFYKYIIGFNYQFDLYELYKNNINEIFNHQFFNSYNIDKLYEENIKKLSLK